MEVELYRGIAFNTIGHPSEEQERGFYLRNWTDFFVSNVEGQKTKDVFLGLKTFSFNRLMIGREILGNF